MRVQALRATAVAAVLGAVVGAVVAVAGRWWVSHQRVTDFGYFTYTPVRNATNGVQLQQSLAPTWWQLLWPAVLVGAVVGVLGAGVLTIRRNGTRPLPRGWRRFLALGAIGVVLGAAVGGALYLRTPFGQDAGQPRRYVDYFVEPDDDAYSSTLSVAFDEQPSQVVALLGVCAGAGLVGGLVAAGVGVAATRVRTRTT